MVGGTSRTRTGQEIFVISISDFDPRHFAASPGWHDTSWRVTGPAPGTRQFDTIAEVDRALREHPIRSRGARSLTDARRVVASHDSPHSDSTDVRVRALEPRCPTYPIHKILPLVLTPSAQQLGHCDRGYHPDPLPYADLSSAKESPNAAERSVRATLAPHEPTSVVEVVVVVRRGRGLRRGKRARAGRAA